MKSLHKIIAASLLASATTAGSGIVLAASPITANIAVASNYIWRGKTQSSDAAGVSGGIDYAHASGAHAGIWVSNTDGTNYEQDITLGYGGKAAGMTYDVSYIAYQYPVVTGSNFSELVASVGYGPATFTLANTIGADNSASKNDMYMSLGAGFEVKKGLTLSVLAGNYDFKSGTDYSHIQLSLSKDDFTFALDDTDETGAAGKMRASVSWSKSFDL